MPFDFVAIPTRAVVGGRGSSFGPLFSTAQELRRGFHLKSDARVLLVSVSKDPFLERYWRWAKQTGAAERLAKLDVTCMTIPNFSFCTDAPRPHLLYNRGRLEACFYELAEAGVAVAPHIHALNASDRLHWCALLREHRQLRHVTREFQTGNDETAVEELAWIQDQIGRDLHPIVVGGARHRNRIRELFSNYTIVNSTPFMKAVKGHARLLDEDGILSDVPNPTGTDRELGGLIRRNVATYSKWVGRPSAHVSMADVYERAIHAREAARASRQINLPFEPEDKPPTVRIAGSGSVDSVAATAEVPANRYGANQSTIVSGEDEH